MKQAWRSGYSATILGWQRLSRREQWLLSGLSGLILGILAFSLVWQPTQQRLSVAERQYRHQQNLAAQLQQTQPPGIAPVISDQPLSLRLSESATTAGLELQQMDADNDLLRLTLSGEANVLLRWLHRVERDGVSLQSLTLEKRDAVLQARVVIR
ncbi:type II secretory protein PulM [Pseudomonas frederiksbergensis]|uniref:Type II secretory protein PulM n=1 Tax=Pseudomonas frederiksbergensis TaxID=104087 RepID=A0A423K214_9PSED|nr:type II secretion system protein GspM [Pseudomonas frederiksbergensis]RON44959.1 type II secretory protein PulM [Pseudomonas frederiksbergensis]